MSVIPLNRTNHMISLVDYLTRAGAPIRPLLEKAKLPIDAFDNPEKLVPSAATWRFRELAAQTSGVPNIVINAMENLEISNLGDFGKALMQMPTLHRLLTKFSALSRTQTSNLLMETRKQKNGDVFFLFRYEFIFDFGEWQSTLYVLQIMIKLVRMVSPEWSPSITWISCASSPLQTQNAIEKLRLGKTSFGNPFTGFLIPHSMLALPIVQRVFAKVAAAHFNEQQVWAGAPGHSYTATLQQILLSYMDDLWLHVEEAAEVAGLSVRTMQRRLHEEGTTYSCVIESTRAEFGAQLLESTDTRIADIAAQLGYTTQGNFTRAFRRWAGVTPLEFRRYRNTVQSKVQI